MRPVTARAAALKTLDLILQVLTFIVMVWLLFHSNLGPFALFVMAAVQYLSAIAWRFAGRSLPVHKTRRWMQPVFLIAGSFLLLLALLCWLPRGTMVSEAAGYVGAILLYVLVFAGPLLGLGYFLLTAAEIALYRRQGARLSFR